MLIYCIQRVMYHPGVDKIVECRDVSLLFNPLRHKTVCNHFWYNRLSLSSFRFKLSKSLSLLLINAPNCNCCRCFVLRKTVYPMFAGFLIIFINIQLMI